MTDHFDVAVIGGGIVGCAVVFELGQRGYSCALLEKNISIMSEASAGNSGMLHSGFDAPAGTLEQQCIMECQRQIFPVLDDFKVPYNKCGAHIVAWTDEEANNLRLKLPELLKNGEACGANTMGMVSPEVLHRREPYLRQGAKAVLAIPEESVVDSNILGLCYAHHASRQGAKIFTSCEVHGFRDKTMFTSRGPIKASVAINCAGLYGDVVDSFAGRKTFTIKPRKGQYSLFSKKEGHLLNSTLLAVPTERTKGIALFRTAYGNLVMGPTAEETSERSMPTCDPGVHTFLTDNAKKLLPALNASSDIAQYSGIRPATEWKDYQIKAYPEIGWMTVGGIRSTGVSGSLGIADYVQTRLADMDVIPIRGSTRVREELTWHLEQDARSSALRIHHCCYPLSHPISIFGTKEEFKISKL